MKKVFLGIIIIIVLAITILGGIFAWQKLSDSQELVSDIIGPNQTAGWKTYTNERNGISFKYPSNFIINTIPNEYWKEGYKTLNKDYSYRFFELVDIENGCYIGNLIPAGIEGNAPDYLKIETKNFTTADGQKLEVKYWNFYDKPGLIFISSDNSIYDIDDINHENGYYLSFGLASLTDQLVSSNYRDTSKGDQGFTYINENCVSDYEKILSTFKFTK